MNIRAKEVADRLRLRQSDFRRFLRRALERGSTFDRLACCTLLVEWTDVTGPHPSLNLSCGGSTRHTLGNRFSQRAKPHEGMMPTQHHWA